MLNIEKIIINVPNWLGAEAAVREALNGLLIGRDFKFTPPWGADEYTITYTLGRIHLMKGEEQKEIDRNSNEYRKIIVWLAQEA